MRIECNQRLSPAGTVHISPKKAPIFHRDGHDLRKERAETEIRCPGDSSHSHANERARTKTAT